jgi:hypothetical protein
VASRSIARDTVGSEATVPWPRPVLAVAILPSVP